MGWTANPLLAFALGWIAKDIHGWIVRRLKERKEV